MCFRKIDETSNVFKSSTVYENKKKYTQDRNYYF